MSGNDSDNDGTDTPAPDRPVDDPQETEPTPSAPGTEPTGPAEPESDPPAQPIPEDPPITVEPPRAPDFGTTVFSRLSRDEILEALEQMTVLELNDLLRRWKIVFALNGISAEFRTLTATQRLAMVEAIVVQQDEAAGPT